MASEYSSYSYEEEDSLSYSYEEDWNPFITDESQMLHRELELPKDGGDPNLRIFDDLESSRNAICTFFQCPIFRIPLNNSPGLIILPLRDITLIRNVTKSHPKPLGRHLILFPADENHLRFHHKDLSEVMDFFYKS